MNWHFLLHSTQFSMNIILSFDIGLAQVINEEDDGQPPVKKQRSSGEFLKIHFLPKITFCFIYGCSHF